MTSVHSQPVNTISYTETQPFIKQNLQPKFIHLLDDNEKPHPTSHNQPKKLPFNFFLSATQYNKMLITNGKNRKKKTPQTIDGLITTLQYMNDPIFQREKYKKYKLKQTLKETIKQTQIPQQKPIKKHQQKPNILNRTHVKNSFSHDQSQECIKNKHRTSKLSNGEMKKEQGIDYETLIPKNQKYSINYKPNNQKSKGNGEERKSHSSFEKTSKVNKTNINDQAQMSKSQIKKNSDISHLLIKSLIDFNKQKKAQHFNNLVMEKTKSTKDQYLRLLNQKIRSHNLQNSRRTGGSRSRSKSRSITKHQISLQYWDQIKDDVLNSLKNDNYSHPLKQQLNNYNFNVYDHKEIPQRKPRMSNQQINHRRLIRGHQAQKSLQHKSKQKKSAQNRKKQNLKSLQKQRKKRISHNPKKSFKPTADLIRSAFQNLVQPSPYQKEQGQVRNVSSIFTNEGIRTVKMSKKQNGKK